jgi:RNA polymerase sigma-70 factor, ECF subfamily
MVNGTATTADTDLDTALERHRTELTGYCYRMLGSAFEAEDAVQDTMIRAWKGYDRFEGRSSLRSWLYRIATNVCLDMLTAGNRRARPMDLSDSTPLARAALAPRPDSTWLEPMPDAYVLPAAEDPAEAAVAKESVRLAFMAALQKLPPRQRAVLILREVLQFSAAEVARILDTTPAAVNSALQRARKAVDQRVPRTAQRAELDALGADGRRDLVDAFVTAWERADVAAILELLAEDVRFTIPPLPAWFRGREDIGRFFTERMFATPWRLLPIRANGQLAFACYQGDPDGDRFRLGAVNVVSVRAGRIVEMAGFLEPGVHRRFGLPDELPKR